MKSVIGMEKEKKRSLKSMLMRKMDLERAECHRGKAVRRKRLVFKEKKICRYMWQVV